MALRRSATTPQPIDAVAGLREQWDDYPRQWRDDEFINKGTETLGHEWGGAEFASLVIDSVPPELLDGRDVVELGCGGGRFSRQLAPRVKSLVCADISPKMLELTRAEVRSAAPGAEVSFQLLDGADFAGLPARGTDFVFSYDVQLHLQPQNIFSYMLDARRILRPGGHFMLHQIDLARSGGMSAFLIQYESGTWKGPFESQDRMGHIYYMSRDQIEALAAAAGYEVAKLVQDFPPKREMHHELFAGRDLIAYLRKLPSRLAPEDGTAPRLIRAEGEDSIFAVIGGERVVINSAAQFERAGLSWDAIENVTAVELERIPLAAEPLAYWE